MARRGMVISFVAAVLAGLAGAARADEGMWLVSHPPLEKLKNHHEFTPPAGWLERMQKSAVRFNLGGSGSIVSSDGLVMTNHHVASEAIAQLSTSDRNLMRDGFLAQTREEELRCPDLELNVLWEVRDVTGEVRGAGEGLPDAEAGRARRAAMARIEQAAEAETGLDAQVVTLYQGGQYHLYLSKRYTDVRLVFAPEESIAFFGGDTDNFEYPRYCLDVTFFRIYENGEPLKPEHFLRWSGEGVEESHLVFVFGHPGRTSRAHTMDHARFRRDVEIPLTLQSLWRAEVRARTFAGRSAEHERIVREDLFGIANSRKAMTGLLAGLHDPRVMEMKDSREQELREFIEGDASRRERWGGAWELVREARAAQAQILRRQRAVSALRFSEAVSHASTLVQMAEEDKKPSEQRLREYTDAGRDSLLLGLLSEEPLYPTLEAFRLESWLSLLAEQLGGDDPLVQRLLAGKSPRERARELIAGTGLLDASRRRELAEGGASAIEGSSDPLLAFWRLADGEWRELRRRFEDEVEARDRRAYAMLAEARFEKDGDRVYPDATFSLRMAFGSVDQMMMEDGTFAEPITTVAGLFERADARRGEAGFELPVTWQAARDALHPRTPMNFISTADIIGGNSGSPVVDRKGEVVGLIFDGNLDSLLSDVLYVESTHRAIAVDARGIIAALETVYGAHDLVRELRGRGE